MLRYYKRHIGWVIAALLFGVATQLLTPFSAIMEQRMIDLIISGNMEGFRRDLWMAGAVVFAVALSYFFSGVARKCFEARLDRCAAICTTALWGGAQSVSRRRIRRNICPM